MGMCMSCGIVVQYLSEETGWKKKIPIVVCLCGKSYHINVSPNYYIQEKHILLMSLPSLPCEGSALWTLIANVKHRGPVSSTRGALLFG